MKSLNIRAFIAIAVFLFILPAIMTDVLYRDDAYRMSISGGYWWWMGRPVADLAIWITSLHKSYIINSHPFGLISSTMVFIFVLYTVVEKRLSVTKMYAIAPLPLLMVSPLFIQNISYQYDAPGMILGISAAVYSFYTMSSTRMHKALGFAFLFISLCLYQPTANIFVGLSAAHLILRIRQSSSGRIKDLLLECSVFVLAYVSYFLIVIKALGYSGSSRGNILPVSEIPSNFMKVSANLNEYISTSMTYISRLEFYVIPLIALASYAYRNKKEKINWKKITYFLLSFSLGLLMVYSSIIGVSFIVPEGIAGSRVLVSSSILYFILAALVIKSVNDRLPLLFVSIIAAPAIILSFQSFKYSSEQRRFEYTVLNSILPKTESFDKVYVIGNMRLSQPVARAISENPSIGLTVSSAQPWVYKRLLYSIGGVNIDQGWPDTPQIAIELKGVGKLTSNNRYYSIYENENNAVVVMK